MGDTLSGETQISEATKSQALTATGGLTRNTVLPRVEWVGPTPKVNPSQRHRFEELGLLGEGGMGEVVLAQDHDIERQVALKRLPENTDLGRVLRFVEEIRTVGRLEHPNIVPVHDVGVDASGRYYFVMKHLHGETLEAIIGRLRDGDAAAHRRFTFPVRLQIMMSVMNALAYAHKQGFIHRDLKPANIMVGPYGEVTVMDWGLAKRIRAAEMPGATISGPREGTALQTQLGSIMGTPLYMSPEQARGENDTLDERSDLYALTVVFHEFLHLDHYLQGRADIQSVLEGVKKVTPVLNISSRRGREYQVPSEMGWFLKKGFQKEAAQRYASVDEMTDELQRILRGECRVDCQRTLMKRVLGTMIRVTDERPRLVLSVSTLSIFLFVAAIVKSVLIFT